MKVNEYQKLTVRTINPELTNNELEKHALFGMVGEIGEIHSIYRKTYQGHRIKPKHLKKNWEIYCGSYLNFVSLLSGQWKKLCK